MQQPSEYVENKLINLAKDQNTLDWSSFGELLTKIGLGGDENLINKLFWVFDSDGNGEVDHKELAIGLEMLKQNTFAEKLDKFFEVCDIDNSGTIDKKEFYKVLKESLLDFDDRNDLWEIVNEMFEVADINGNGELTKNELKLACDKD